MSSICVIGAGYVGLATAVCFAHLGHEVVTVEIDETRLALLVAGEPPFLEHGMKELLVEGLASGRLRFVCPELAEYEQAEFVFLCLPTPQAIDGTADLSTLQDAVAGIALRLRPGAVVIDKSTVPVGTTRSIADMIDRSDVAVVSNPEFLQEGTAISAFLDAERVVIGAENSEAAQRVATLYATISSRILLTGIESAELAKYACNAFLAMKLSFVNAIASLCDLTGADISEVTAVMGADHRIGKEFLRPGPGWGGSCFPKDTIALIASAAEAGLDLTLVRAVVASNQESFARVVATIMELCDDQLEGRRIAAWGLSFKAGTDDVRSSPAIEVINRLQDAGASVVAYDPAVSFLSGIATVGDPYVAATGADALVVLTEWPAFALCDLGHVAAVMARPCLLDTRGIIDPDRARHAGLNYLSIGHPRQTTGPEPTPAGADVTR